MEAQIKPVFGIMQPALGGLAPVTFRPVGRPPKLPQLTGINKVLSDNIRLRMVGAFPAASTDTERIAALAAKAGIAPETIRRIVVGETNPRLDNIEAIAVAFGVTAAVLLVPFRDSSDGGELQRTRRR